MRDIVPSKPKRRRSMSSPENTGKELYEASFGARRRASKVANDKPLTSDRAKPKKFSVPEVPIAPKKETTLPKEDLPNPTNATLKGSKVPVTNINVAKNVASMHSDYDHKKDDEERRPLFAIASRTKKDKLKTKSEPKAKVKAKKKKMSPVRVGHGERRILLSFFGLVIVAGVIAAVIFLPKANISLRLRTAPLLVDQEIQIGAGDSATSGVIKGTSYFRESSIEGSVQVLHTETVGSKAVGQVVIVNKTTEEQKIRERSRLVTADGQLFYMVKHLIIPANSSVAVQVEAAEAGSNGNIEPQRLNFPGLDESSQQIVYGHAENALSGGAGETIAVVAEEDIVSAQKAAATLARSQTESEIKAELPEGWELLEESWDVSVDDVEIDAELGEKVPEINYVGRVIVRVIAFEKAALEKRLRNALESRLDEDFMLFPGDISYTKSVKSINWDEAIATISTRVTHTTVPNLSLETLRDKLAGRSGIEAEQYLEGLPGVRSASMELWPFWVKSIPRIEKRIFMEFESEQPS